MFNQYNLKVNFYDKQLFDGDFVSINKLIKVACCFDKECIFLGYDYIHEKYITNSTIHDLLEVFKNGEIYI